VPEAISVAVLSYRSEKSNVAELSGQIAKERFSRFTRIYRSAIASVRPF
jgi:hypothetical protein